MLRILFIHGLASSGAFKTAATLRTLLRPCEVLSPDFPVEPDKMEDMLSRTCEAFSPNLVVGHSWGGFWAQKLRGYRRILINPSFHTSALMRTMVGEVEYLSPRSDGAKSFILSEVICQAYEKLEESQFKGITLREIELVDGLFALEDERVHSGPEFEQHYPGKAHYYHGGHLPTFPEIKKYLLPLVK